MAARQEPSNNDRNANSSRHLTTDNEREDFNGSGSGQTASELHASGQHENALLEEDIEYEDTVIVATVSTENQLNSAIADYLLALSGFEIIFVCDDSNSMTNLIKGTNTTRWQELCTIVKKLLPIAMKFDTNGVDIRFLNRRNHIKVQSTERIDRLFAKGPGGYTLLVPMLTEIFQLPMARSDREKKLLVFVATDGRPTDLEGNDQVEQLQQLMTEVRNAETTYVSFLLCTDERETMDFMARWDQTMTNVDVTDDYENEREKIRQCQEDPNYPFSYDDYIVKALVGSIIPRVDRLNERKITPRD